MFIFVFYRSLYLYVHICSLLLILFYCMWLRTKEKGRKEGAEMTMNKNEIGQFTHKEEGQTRKKKRM